MARRGITLVELLVVFAILAILASLTLAAVQFAREVARRNQCQSRMRQIGFGIAQYESAFKSYPSGFTSFSVHVSILPFLEQQPTYEEIRTYYRTGGRNSQFTFVCPIFICPSDSAPEIVESASWRSAGTNYAACSGSWYTLNGGYNGVFRDSLHTGRNAPTVSAADISDGLSNTIGLSEILRADGTSQRLRVVWNTPMVFRHGTELDAFADYCESIPPEPSNYGWLGNHFVRGTPWSTDSMTITLYSHVSTPNRPSCFNKNAVNSAAATATSNHRGGVNSIFMDGHCEFVANTIDRVPWRKWATLSD